MSQPYREFDTEQCILKQVIRQLWMPNVYTKQVGPITYIGAFDRSYYRTNDTTPVIWFSLEENVVGFYNRASFAEDGSFLGTLTDEFSLSPASMEILQPIVAGGRYEGSQIPGVMAVLERAYALIQIKYYVEEQSQEWVTASYHLDFPFTVEVNWSACGAKDAYTAKLFGAAVNLAGELAEMIEQRFGAARSECEGLPTEDAMEAIVRKTLADTLDSDLPLPPAVS